MFKICKYPSLSKDLKAALLVFRLQHQQDNFYLNIDYQLTNHLVVCKNGDGGGTTSKFEQIHKEAVTVSDKMNRSNVTDSKRHTSSSCNKTSEKDTGCKAID